MNNNYDRGEPDEVLDLEPADPSVGLFLLVTGETVLTEYTTSFDDLIYYFSHPQLVTLDGDDTVVHTNWMPLSKSRRFEVSSDKVVCHSEPLDTLVESYRGNQNG